LREVFLLSFIGQEDITGFNVGVLFLPDRQAAQVNDTGSASWCYVAECGDEYASARFDGGVSAG
jgi:hypothetical protein